MNYKIFNDKNELIDYFISLFTEQINSYKKDKIYIALSGGNTPRPVLSKLAVSKEQPDWNKVFFLQVDERCVPPDDDQSNYKMIKENLLEKISFPQESFLRIRGENEPEAECKRYADEIINRNIIPDIVLLGMGSDGHTASIFPNQFFLIKCRDVAAVSVFPGSDQKRITLTEGIINNADLKIFLVTGKDKAHTLYNIFNKHDDDLPAGRIKGKVIWLLDSEAGSEIKVVLS